MALAVREAVAMTHQAALDELAAPIEVVVVRELRKLLRRNANHALNLTAAVVDLNALNAVPAQWTQIVVDLILPMYGEVYNAAGMAAWLAESHPQSARVAENIAQAIPDVVPVNAVSYLQGTANRLAAIGDQGWLLTRDALAQGMTEGLSIPALSKAVTEAIGVAEERATTIARTEVVSAANAGSLDQVRQLSGHGGPRFKVWLATLDNRVRPTHAEAEGKTVLLDQTFEVGGALLDFPGDPGGPPGEVINCRCTLTYTDTPPPGFSETQGLAEEEAKPPPPKGKPAPMPDYSASPLYDPDKGWPYNPAEDAFSTEARLFDDQSIAHMSALQDAQRPEMFRDEVRALDNYIGSGYRDINLALRGDYAYEMTPEIQGWVDSLDSALASETRYITADETTVWRGVYGMPRVAPGELFTESGYLSTSVRPRTAWSFSGAGGSDSTFWHITLPEGTPFLAGSTSEGELVLPRGTVLRVEKVQEAPNGMQEVWARVIPE
jgi:SPP1 gp7 family putative phage head morphogenesis protein